MLFSILFIMLCYFIPLSLFLSLRYFKVRRESYGGYYKKEISVAYLTFIGVIYMAIGIGIGLYNPIHFNFNQGTFHAALWLLVGNSLILVNEYKARYLIHFSIFTCCIALILSLANSIYFNHNTIMNRMTVTTITDPLLIDENEKRLVVKSNAIEMAAKVLGGKIERLPDVSLGSIFNIDKDLVNIDVINGRRVWVLPLDFSTFMDQSRVNNSIPAFIMVDTYTPNGQAELITKNLKGDDISIKWSEGMLFGNQLNRWLYDNYSTYNIYDSRIRIDDDLNPHYIGYVVEATTGYKNYKSSGVIHLNLQTGEHSFYTKDEVVKALPWLELIESPELSLDLIDDWAYYRESSIPLFNAPSSILETTSSDGMALIETSIGTAFYTGLTSNSLNDDSLYGSIGVNTITGEAFFRRSNVSTGGDEKAAILAVSSILGKDSDFWKPKQPIPYNLLGKYPSYIVPVISYKSKMFIGIGIVNIEHTTKVVFQKGNDINSAIIKYLKKIKASTHDTNLSSSSLIDLGGTIDTLHVIAINDTPYFYITLQGNDDVLRCDSQSNLLCFKLKEGKSFEFSVNSNDDDILIIESFAPLVGDIKKI